MGWIEKGKPTSFDTTPIEGLYFLDGDRVAQIVKLDWTKGQKYPLIVFPSGLECDLWPAGDPGAQAIVHLFGEMDLPLRDTRDGAFKRASDVAEQCGYFVDKIGENQLELWGHDEDEHLILTYDDNARRMVDAASVKEKRPPRPAQRMKLLDEKTRARLPELYSGEEQGMEALAQVKFFTPDSHWTWYASEFDGDDTFFGLVVGDEVELGYFSLSELEQALGPMGLAIERDRYFSPKTLRELKALHERDRG